MMNDNPMMLIISILERDKGRAYMEMLNDRNITFHTQTTGYGTAPSEMMDILGLGSNDKDIVLTLAPKNAIEVLSAELWKNLGSSSRYRGLMMVLELTAINRLTAEIITRTTPAETVKEGDTQMKNEYKHQLILISVNQGHTDEVMHTAKKAGAMGGTILRARLADTEKLAQFDIQDVQEEREIIMILAETNVAAQIMTQVNSEHGTKSDAHGITCAMPVDRAFKI